MRFSIGRPNKILPCRFFSPLAAIVTARTNHIVLVYITLLPMPAVRKATKSARGKRPRFRLRAFHAPCPHNQSPIKNGTAPTTPTSMNRCRKILWAAFIPDFVLPVTAPQFVLKLDWAASLRAAARKSCRAHFRRLYLGQMCRPLRKTDCHRS